MGKFSKKLGYVTDRMKKIFSGSIFGFVSGHYYLNPVQLKQIKALVGDTTGTDLIESFEQRFCDIVGDGHCVSYASARMAFFALLKTLQIGPGDEIVLQAANCSVMVTAILRTGATPVFADIDPKTFGSSALEIESKISSRTKLIVAQHSFGIPCEIETIASIATAKKIFLLEDCALTLGSEIRNIPVGNFGNAALFSTDHSKPINTFIGGILYFKNSSLFQQLKKDRDDLPNLSKQHQHLIFQQIVFEKKFLSPRWFAVGNMMKLVTIVLKKTKLQSPGSPYLVDDYHHPDKQRTASYPYPAKLPVFLAQLGLFELERWQRESANRQLLLEMYKSLFNKHKVERYLPPAYFDNSLTIVPLRFVFNYERAKELKKKAKKHFDTEGYWFLKPIVACEDPEDLGYLAGSCKQVEHMNNCIINFPCVINPAFEKILIKKAEEIIACIQPV